MSPPAFLICIQVLTSLISLMTSIIMASSIAWFGSEGSTPSRRIILGLSISDIFQSLTILFGPMAVPLSNMSKSGEKEVTSCQANGFLLHVATTGMLLHTVFLCVYYLCKLKYRMSNDEFMHKVERKLRAFTVAFSFISGTIPLIMNAYHANGHYLYVCNIAKVPTGCDREPDIVGPCDSRNERIYEILTVILIYAVFVASLTVIITTIGLLYHHIFLWNQRIKSEISIPTTLRQSRIIEKDEEYEGEKTHSVNDEENAIEGDHEEKETPQSRVQRLSRLYRREMMTQAISFVVIFCLMYIPPMMGCTIVSLIFYPLGGFLNILVYTRPKVSELRRRYPGECSRLRGFWLVLKMGGEIPDEIGVSSSCCMDCCKCPSLVDESEYDDSHYYHGSSNRIHLSSLGF